MRMRRNRCFGRGFVATSSATRDSKRCGLSRFTTYSAELAVLKDLLSRWPLIQQIQTGADGNGLEAMSERTRNLRPKTDGAQVAKSICPYCGVGCGQLAFHKDGKLISIEGDPQSPISRGHLCPKGADTYELHTHPGRLQKVKYRAPYAREWQELDLETAMDMVADRAWATRERTFQDTREGQVLMQTTAMA